MKRIAKFFKVSEDEFLKVGDKTTYQDIILPKRATAGSAGYDFFCTRNFYPSSRSNDKNSNGD